jgi:simple sugar transport system permease protein
MAETTQTSRGAPAKLGLNVPSTPWGRILGILSRHREASIAVVAVVLVIYFQLGNSNFLSSQELSVVLRDTGRFGLIAVAEVMLMITGEIDLSVGSTFSLAPYVMVLMTITWGIPLALSSIVGILLGVLIGVVNGVITVRFRVP